jgi:hypothetical protein
VCYSVFLLRVACRMRQHWSAVDLLRNLHCKVHAVAAAIGSHSPLSAALGSAQRLSAVVGSADKTLERTPPHTCRSSFCVGLRHEPPQNAERIMMRVQSSPRVWAGDSGIFGR